MKSFFINTYLQRPVFQTGAKIYAPARQQPYEAARAGPTWGQARLQTSLRTM